MQKYKPESYNNYSERGAIEKWVFQDIKEAEFELKDYIKMRDPEMIDYWKDVIAYFKNFIKEWNIAKVKVKADVRLGNEAEMYASRKILDRLGLI